MVNLAEVLDLLLEGLDVPAGLLSAADFVAFYDDMQKFNRQAEANNT